MDTNICMEKYQQTYRKSFFRYNNKAHISLAGLFNDARFKMDRAKHWSKMPPGELRL